MHILDCWVGGELDIVGDRGNRDEGECKLTSLECG